MQPCETPWEIGSLRFIRDKTILTEFNCVNPHSSLMNK